MKKVIENVKFFLECEDGPTAVEYAVMLALILVAVITTVRAIGTNANTQFGTVRDALT